MKFLIFTLLLLFTLIPEVKAFDTQLLENNKETISRHLRNSDIAAVKYWEKNHSSRENLKDQARLVLKNVFDEIEALKSDCDLGLSNRLDEEGTKAGLIKDQKDHLTFLTYLRHQNLIDDILYRILKTSANVNYAMAIRADYGYPRKPMNVVTRQNANADLVKLYADFNKFPDDVQSCSLHAYGRLTNSIQWKNSADRDNQIRKLNYLALRDEVISLETYHRLEVLREYKVTEWPIYTIRYLEIVKNSKDRLNKGVRETHSTNDFSDQYVLRRENLTQRGRLYKTFDSTQVMMLADLIRKTGKRMDARNVTLNIEYKPENGEVPETEIYVFSPMEQYRIAIRMLKKEMAEVMRSEMFKGTAIEYDDLIAASFETGLIRSEELDYIIKFEDFWNPKTPKWKTYANFASSIAGSATMFLPPPWNFIGALALVVTQSRFLNNKEPVDPDNNWNTII